MKASTERKIIRWMHIILSIPVIGYIWGPVDQLPTPALLVKTAFFPIIILAGVLFMERTFIKEMVAQQLTNLVRLTTNFTAAKTKELS